MRATPGRALLVATLLSSTLLSWTPMAEADGPPPDRVTGTRADELVDRAHHITMTLSPRHATLVVRRTVFNGADEDEQAELEIQLPSGGVATQLRTLSALAGPSSWFPAELMEAGVAATHYNNLPGLQAASAKAPALLAWESQDRLSLRVFPCAPQATRTVEYTVVIPSEYRLGRYHFELPALGTEQLPATLRIVAAATVGTVYVAGKRAVSSSTHTLDAELDVALEPRKSPPFDAVVANVAVDEHTTLGHFQLALARHISLVPRGAYVVVLLDESLSITPAAARAQRAAAASYLSHFTDAHVRILGFDRRVREHHERFVTAARAIEDLATLAPARRNGSEVALALSAAERILSQLGTRHPKRILLLSDGLMRDDITPSAVHATVGVSGAVVHFGVVTNASTPALAVDDDHLWAPAFRSSGGLAWTLDAPSVRDDALDRAVLEWVRPTHLRHVTLGLPHSPLINGGLEVDDLAEGEGVSNVWLQEEPLPYLKVEGELWATPFRQVFRPDRATGNRWAALAFGSAVEPELTPEQAMVLAARGHAVSPVTSLVVLAPGVRPPPIGFPSEMGSAMGYGSAHSLGPRARVPASPFDHEGYLVRALRIAWASCALQDSVRLQLETTLNEVAHVHSIEPSATADAAQAACLEAGAWSLALPAEFDSRLQSFRLTVPAG